MSRTTKDERQGGFFDLFDAPAPPPPPPAPRLPTADELTETHVPTFFGCFATEAQAEADAAKFRTDAEPITVQRVADQWNVYRWNAKPKPEGEPEEVEEAEGDDPDALKCVDCGELGAIGEFIHHDEAGGALCPPCDLKREPNCCECGAAFYDHRGVINVARFSLPTGRFLCYHCCERFRENKPQRDLDRTEAEDEAVALMTRLQWRDEGHRNRVLFHLRGGMRPSQPKNDKGKIVKHTAAQVEGLWRTCRQRPLQEIADEYWPLLVAYDAALREGRELAVAAGRWKPELAEKMDELEREANHGSVAIHGGRRSYPGPYRLRSLVKWRARREGRLPMYGVESRWRFECRGMHVIADMKHSLCFHLDPDKHRPGDPSFSSTGYRSFTGSECSAEGETPEQWARRTLEAYIDNPKGKDGAGGLGGKLERWVPFVIEYARQRRDGDRMFQPDGKDPDTLAHWNRLADEGEALLARHRIELDELLPRKVKQAAFDLGEPEADDEELDDFDDDELDEEPEE